MKIWNRIKDGSSCSYSLNKEYEPTWYATVSKHDGKWWFAIGLRGTDTRFTSKKSWKSLPYAKNQAITAIIHKIGEAELIKLIETL